MHQPVLRSIQTEAAEAGALCREILADPKFASINARLAGAPADAEGWFRLLGGFPHDGEGYAWLTGMKAVMPRDAMDAGVSPGHFAALSALPAAALRITSAPVTDGVKRRYIAFIHQIATRAKRWEVHFDVEGARFHDIAHLASLRRYPAGDLAFQINARLPVFMGLRVHPLDWPGLLREMIFSIGGVGPALSLHFSYARDNWLVLQQVEFERALWRIAKVIELHPSAKALMSNAWFHSPLVGETFPRLTWMRTLFVEGGAYVIDLGPGQKADICYNSAKRQELYEQGKFCPRQTLVLWPRDQLLAWAARRSDLADEGEEAPVPPPMTRPRRIEPGRPRRTAKHNSPVTLWDGLDLMKESGPRYALFVLLLPAFVLAMLSLIAGGWIAGMLGLVLGFCAAYTFQYFLLQ